MTASCPSCGGALEFRHGASLLAVCSHCGSAVARKGADLEAYGKVAELIPTPSRLRLGIAGRDGVGGAGFQLIGRLQLDHGQGTWDEWHAAFDDGSSGWLAESQGRFHLMREQALPPLPSFSALEVGSIVDLGSPGTRGTGPPGAFVVAEVKAARFQRAAGELPFAAKPGTVLHYADLSGPKGRFATIDYGDGEQAVALWAGRERDLASLGIAASDLAPDAPGREVSAQSLSCTQCAGPLEVRAPDLSRRIACPWCGSLLDVGERYAVIEATTRVGFTPSLKLGSRGTFAEGTFTLIGAMERSVTVEGTRYPWREYLLYEPAIGFRWLTEANGHWSFVIPLAPGDFGPNLARSGFRSGRSLEHGGKSFRHFQSGTAKVDHVLGEFYWAVARGETTETRDYVAPPEMISLERNDEEINVSLGTYVEPDVVWRSFGQPGKPPARTGVGPNQPSSYAARFHEIGRTASMFAALLLIVFLGWRIVGTRTPLTQSFNLTEATMGPEAPDTAVFTQPFALTRRGNLAVQVTAPVSNNWIYFDGALINETSGEFFPFDVEVSYYSGSDSDGSWSEGGQTATRFIGGVNPGQYVLRLAPRWEGSRPAQSFTVRARSGLPRFGHLMLALLAIAAYPLALGWSWFRFERRRWAESDHPWGESS